MSRATVPAMPGLVEFLSAVWEEGSRMVIMLTTIVDFGAEVLWKYSSKLMQQSIQKNYIDKPKLLVNWVQSTPKTFLLMLIAF